MIVYGDLLFTENLIIGSVLLYITGEIFGISFRKPAAVIRLACGGVMCGLFSMLIFLHANTLLLVALEAGFALAVCMVVFGRERLWRRALTFILVTYFMGGITMGLLLVTKNPGVYAVSGIYTGDMKAALLALFTAAGLFTAKLIIRTVSARKFFKEHVFDVKIVIGGKNFETGGFVDTGNHLTDPVSGKPAAVAQESLWCRLDNAGVMMPERMGVIPYEGINGGGLMISVRTDYVEIRERRIRGAVIARGTEKLDMDGRDAQHCELLLSKYMTDREV